MKKQFLILLLLLPQIPIIAQKAADFSSIDKIARETPKKYTNSIEELTAYLTKNAHSDLEKVRAFYIWVTENIRYDTKLYFGKPIDPAVRHKKQQYPSVLKYKKGVCEGYANLFHELCVTAKIPSEIVTGPTKRKGRVLRTSHAWNAVKIDNQWFLVDNTWGAGYVDVDKKKFHRVFQEKYFLAAPKVFIQDHYPQDYIFQMLPTPIQWLDYKKKEIPETAFKNESLDPINFQDSINYYHALPSDQKELNRALRILRFNPESNYAKAKAAEAYNRKAWNKIKKYRLDTKPLKDNLDLLTTEQLDVWQKLIIDCKELFIKAESYSKLMKPGDKDFRRIKVIRKNIKLGRSSLENMEGQLEYFHRYLERKK